MFNTEMKSSYELLLAIKGADAGLNINIKTE